MVDERSQLAVSPIFPRCQEENKHNTTQHNTQHNTTQHNTTQHNTTQHNTTHVGQSLYLFEVEERRSSRSCGAVVYSLLLCVFHLWCELSPQFPALVCADCLP